MHVSSSRLSSRGTSLIEAMAALVVFSVGILGVMQMNVLASKQNNVARAQTTASRLARDVADSFERLPFDHTAINRDTSLLQSDPDFPNMDNPDGLMTLEEALAMPGVRPILGASAAITTSEGEGTFFKVTWRTLKFPSSADPEQLRILIMVRFPTPGGGMKQVNTWAIKANPKKVIGPSATNVEF